MGGYTPTLNFGSDAIKTTIINGDFAFCLPRQCEPRLTVAQRDVGVRNYLVVPARRLLPLISLALDVDSNLEVQVPIAMAELLRVGEIKGSLKVSGIVGSINIKEVTGRNTAYCPAKGYRTRCG